MTTERPQSYRFHNGEKAALPFAKAEYETRLAGLRQTMTDAGLNACVFTSMHNIAYYSGFLYCSFGRPFGCVVTHDDCTTISASSHPVPLRRRVNRSHSPPGRISGP